MPAQPLADVARLSGLLAERASEAERGRRLPADVAGALAQAGAFQMLVPRAVGGLECDPAIALATIETVARADASAGWCVMIGATAALPSAYLTPDAARTIFKPGSITAGVFAPMGRAVPVGDGYRVSGRWSWGSGSPHAQWLSGGAIIMDDGKPRLDAAGQPIARMMFFEAHHAQLHDTWHVAGMQGTGSGDFEIRDVHIPAAHTVSLTSDKPWADGPLYRFPLFGLLALGIAAVALGNAQAAMDDLTALATTKIPQGGRRALADRGQVQSTLATSIAQHRAARALVFSEVDVAMAMAQRGEPLDVTTRASLRLAATHATRTSADVVRAMYDLGGGSSVFATSPLQRRFRDAHVATQHLMVALPTFELTGRILLGLPTDATMV
jgi:alkylation response protein AidB-like acyl-CoA dehydrogenase